VVRLYIRTAFQRRGLGTRLLTELVARHPCTKRVRLYAVAGNEPAMRFYRRQGFAIVGEAEEEGVRSLRMERATA
jgi:ribosomal protein S18 acetylase RimI-like enzyme